MAIHEGMKTTPNFQKVDCRASKRPRNSWANLTKSSF